jgi:hypothetical protein
MMKLNDIIFAIEEEIRICVLSFQAIAKKYGVSYEFVNDIWENMCETEFAEG